MSRTVQLSFLAIASFTLAGADYYVQATAAEHTVLSYGIEKYQKNVKFRLKELKSPNAEEEQFAAREKQYNRTGRIKTQAQIQAERKREVDEVIPEVWSHLSSSNKSARKLPQNGSSRKKMSSSFRRIRVGD
ncbi:hypothetical protein KO498_15090 [Lentibacter algarum]|uniref:hypothetical protein n=1 Tax=Lentibacter algarum TaxID=576131 RepID=UPI001C094B00|nr:hypothetical protein [Lentibacter algarum]MBU2983135.1 hypothetical protein [Lentibacter algarum]